MAGLDDLQSGDPPVVVGRFGSPWGVKGWLRVISFTEPADNLLDYRPWLVAEGDGWRAVQVLAARPHGRSHVAQLAECEDRDQAAGWTGREIAVPRSVLPPADEDEFYWRDLLGLQVETLDGVALGTVAQMMPTGANDVLVVRGEGRERLIPFIGQVVRNVDLAAGRISVDWDPEF